MDKVLEKIASQFSIQSLQALYKKLPESTLIFYRLASPIGQCLICRMLFLPVDSLSLSQVKQWPATSKENALLYESLVLFKRLGILEGHHNEIWLNQAFSKSLQLTFHQGISPKSKSLSSESPFEKILLFLFDQSEPVAPIAASLLARCGLYEKEMGITQRGFQFVLQDRADQLWILLSQAVIDSESMFEDLIRFIFCSNGQSNSLFQALGLEHDLNSLFVSTAPESNGFIVVETNYKLYAYTSSPLHIEILKLFSSLRGAFPNLRYGTLSAETFKKAFSRGIEADQIIAYIQKHLHPKCQSEGVPSNLIDQIKLWQLERYRMKREQVVAYSDFAGTGAFESAVKIAEELSGLVLYNAQKKVILVKVEIHDKMKRMLKGRG